MTTKYEKVMQNLRDSLAAVKEYESGEQWCYVRPKELEALIECAYELEAIQRTGYVVYSVKWLERCADE